MGLYMVHILFYMCEHTTGKQPGTPAPLLFILQWNSVYKINCMDCPVLLI